MAPFEFGAKTVFPFALTWLLCFLHLCQANKAIIRAIDVPKAAASGEDVTLHCRFELYNATLYALRWYKDNLEFFRFMPKEKPAGRTFLVTGIFVDVLKSNASSVTLRGISVSTTGIYRCEISAEAPSFDTDTREAFLHVIDPPKGKPFISISKGTFAFNETVVANCTGPKGKPTPQLSWFIGGLQVDEGFVWQSASGAAVNQQDSHQQHQQQQQHHDSAVTRLAVPVSWILEHQSQNHLNASVSNHNVTVELRCSSSVFQLFRDDDYIHLKLRSAPNNLAVSSQHHNAQGTTKNLRGLHGALTNRAQNPGISGTSPWIVVLWLIAAYSTCV